MDELLVGAETVAQVEMVYSGLAAQITVKSLLGEVRLALRMEIEYDRGMGAMLIKQTNSITKTLMCFGQVDFNPASNPLVLGQDMVPNDTHAPFNDKTKYRGLVGPMLYVANATRPEVSVKLSMLSQYLKDPRELHWNAIIRVLRYLKSTSSLGNRVYVGRDQQHRGGHVL